MSKLNPKTDKLKAIIEFLLKWLQKIFNSLAVTALVAIALVVLYQITTRAFPFLEAPVWTPDLSKYLFVYMVVLASCTALVSGKHISLQLFHDKLSDKLKLVYAIICNLLIAAFCIILIKYSWKYTANGIYEESTSLGVKMVWFLASTVVFFILSAVTSVLLFFRDMIKLIEKVRD